MKEKDYQDPDHKREAVKHALEGAAFVALSGLAYHLVTKDSRLRNHGVEKEDIVHATVVKILATRTPFRGDSQLGTWIHRIAVNVSKDMAEKVSSRKDIFEDPELSILSQEDPTLGPEQLAVLQEERERLAAAMAELSDIERVVIFKHHVEGYKLKEIATELNMPLGTVKALNFRGKAKLRKRFGISEEESA